MLDLIWQYRVPFENLVLILLIIEYGFSESDKIVIIFYNYFDNYVDMRMKNLLFVIVLGAAYTLSCMIELPFHYTCMRIETQHVQLRLVLVDDVTGARSGLCGRSAVQDCRGLESLLAEQKA